MFVLYITAKAIIYFHISFFLPLFRFHLICFLYFSCVEAGLAAQICHVAKTASEIISEIYVEQERRQDSSLQDTIHNTMGQLSTGHNTRTALNRTQFTTPGQLSTGHNSQHQDSLQDSFTQFTTPGQLAGQLSTGHNSQHQDSSPQKTTHNTRTALHRTQHQDSSPQDTTHNTRTACRTAFHNLQYQDS